jgi:hypothetical protein
VIGQGFFLDRYTTFIIRPMSVKTALVIFSSFIVLIFQVINGLADDFENQIVNKQALSSRSIHLDGNVQKLSGIQTVVLEPANYQTEFTAYGKALNIQPLISLQHRYQLALNESSSAKAKYLNSEQNITRQQNLYRHGVSSKRSLQGQQLQWKVDKALANAAQVQGITIVDELTLMWGKELTEWVLPDNANQLSNFLNGQQTLLKIVLPVNKHLANGIQTIVVEPSGDRSKADKATLIAVAPHIDNTIQGESYFFKSYDHAIKPGMRVAAWIPEQNNTLTGVIIPKSALIWHMDQSFVYIKTDPESFSRRKIDQYSLVPTGYFIINELKPGEQLVITGSQLLLSEELRVQIPQEDND